MNLTVDQKKEVTFASKIVEYKELKLCLSETLLQQAKSPLPSYQRKETKASEPIQTSPSPPARKNSKTSIKTKQTFGQKRLFFQLPKKRKKDKKQKKIHADSFRGFTQVKIIKFKSCGIM